MLRIIRRCSAVSGGASARALAIHSLLGHVFLRSIKRQCRRNIAYSTIPAMRASIPVQKRNPSTKRMPEPV
jgi:hypothetical protein